MSGSKPGLRSWSARPGPRATRASPRHGTRCRTPAPGRAPPDQAVRRSQAQARAGRPAPRVPAWRCRPRPTRSSITGPSGPRRVRAITVSRAVTCCALGWWRLPSPSSKAGADKDRAPPVGADGAFRLGHEGAFPAPFVPKTKRGPPRRRRGRRGPVELVGLALAAAPASAGDHTNSRRRSDRLVLAALGRGHAPRSTRLARSRRATWLTLTRTVALAARSASASDVGPSRPGR